MPKFSRGVIAYKNGDKFMEWRSTSDAAGWLKSHGFPKATRGRVYDAACGIRKSAYGFTWKLTGDGKRAYGTAKDDDKRLYAIWSDMKSRAIDPANDSYKFEGSIGVSVCKEWENFDGFRNWAKLAGYDEGKILSRVDLSGDYCPENCSWEKPLLDRGYAMVHQRKPVIRRDEKGCITRYGSVTEAAIALVDEGRGHRGGSVPMTLSNIICCLSRRTSSAYGSAWWFEGDENAPKSIG